MPKLKPGKPVISARVIKQTLTKSALINLIAEQNELPHKTAIGVFNTLESVMLGSLHPRGVGEFTLPGLLKITLRKVPDSQGRHSYSQPGHGGNDEGCCQTRQCASENPRLIEVERCRCDILICKICKDVYEHKMSPQFPWE